MELRSFVPVLASLPILFPSAKPSELPPPAPNISVSPAKPQYLIGDVISLTCSAPPGRERVQAFRFSGTSRWVIDVRTSRRSFVHSFNLTGPEDAGAHRCSYTVSRPARGHAHSPDSRPVLIDVRDRPAPPNLTVSPSAITVEGQPLLFLCSALPGHAQRRFRFLQEDLEVAWKVPEGSGSVRLRVDRSGQNLTGNFSCRYEEMTEGRWIASYPSGVVRVVVREPSPPPRLTVDPPSGVVAAGRRLRLTCAAPRRDFRRRFRFFRDGAEVTSGGGGTSGDIGDTAGDSAGDTAGDTAGDIGDTAGDSAGDTTGDTAGDSAGDTAGDTTRGSSELLFPRVSLEFSGNFSCGVEEEVGGAWLEAPPSGGVAVVVRAPPPQPILHLSLPLATSDISDPHISLTCLIPTPSGHDHAPSTHDHAPSGHDHAPSGHTRRRFRFFHDGNRRLSEVTTSHQAQMSIPVHSAAGAGHSTGHFSCQYEEEMDAGWVLSPPSAAVTIPEPDQFELLPLVIGIAVGVAVLLLGLLLAAWLCRRRRRGGSRWRGLSDTGTFPMVDVEVAA